MSVRVHEFDSTGEAYDASQCDDEIADGDVLVVRGERAVAILVEAWPCSLDEATAGESFHVAAESMDWSAVSRSGAPDDRRPPRDYSESVRIAREQTARLT